MIMLKNQGIFYNLNLYFFILSIMISDLQNIIFQYMNLQIEGKFINKYILQNIKNIIITKKVPTKYQKCIIKYVIKYDCHCAETLYDSNFLHLKYLNCSETEIKDVSNLINLTYLRCSYTKISDVSNLVNLIYLECNNTYISDVSMLKNLRRLYCGDNVKKPKHLL